MKVGDRIRLRKDLTEEYIKYSLCLSIRQYIELTECECIITQIKDGRYTINNCLWVLKDSIITHRKNKLDRILK